MFNTQMKNETVDGLKNSIHEIPNNLNKVANQAGRKVRRMLSTANYEISDVRDKVTSEIRSNPVRSSAIALGVGLIIGLILSPSKKSK